MGDFDNILQTLEVSVQKLRERADVAEKEVARLQKKITAKEGSKGFTALLTGVLVGCAVTIMSGLWVLAVQPDPSRIPRCVDSPVLKLSPRLGAP